MPIVSFDCLADAKYFVERNVRYHIPRRDMPNQKRVRAGTTDQTVCR